MPLTRPETIAGMRNRRRAYASGPTKIQSMGASIKRPGEVIQDRLNPVLGSVTRACSVSFADVTNSTISITAMSRTNRLIASYSAAASVTAGGVGVNTEINSTIAIAGTASGLSTQPTVGVVSGSGTNQQTDGSVAPMLMIDPTTLSAQTFSLQTKGINTSGSCNINSAIGRVTEIQG